MKQSKVSTNYLYNVSYQILTFITPIITAPILARTLGAKNLGIYNYTYSIVYWFMLFAMMGVNIYGKKEVAKVSNNREKLSEKFSEIFCLQILTSVISLIIFYLLFTIFDFRYKTIFLFQGLLIISAGLDISWLFVGLENFKKTTIRNFIIKIILVLGIIFLIKNQNDLLFYIIFLAVMTIISQLLLWIGIKKVLDFKFVKLKRVLPHLKENFFLFIPSIATSLYSVFDQTMIGLLYDNVSEVGFYSQAHKFVNMLLFIVTTIGAVMMPRAVKIRASGDNKKVHELTNFTCKIALYLSIPLSVGFSCIAPFFIPWFLSADFTKVGYIIPFLSPIIIFISITNVLGNQYLIVFDQTKKYTTSVVAGCFINLLLNFILIHKFGAYGAAIASVLTEFTVLVIQYLFVRKTFDFSGVFSKFIKYFSSALVMGGVVVIIGICFNANLITNIIQFIIGFIIYILIQFITKDEIQKFLMGKALQILHIKK